jgi:hypothetical protein
MPQESRNATGIDGKGKIVKAVGLSRPAAANLAAPATARMAIVAVGQIRHEDARSGVSTRNGDFNESDHLLAMVRT